MIDAFLRDLRQPEYIHVLLNPIPVYGLAIALLGLLIAMLLRSRPAQIATLAVVLLSATIAWPVYEFGEQSADRVLAMSDEEGGAWLKAHEHRAEQLIYFFYALALVSLAAIAIPGKFPRSSSPLAWLTLIAGFVVVVMGAYIGQAGGKIRHREFRNEPAPKEQNEPADEENR
jgi:hypothetical protein